MAKKSFIDSRNPAMQFISSPAAESGAAVSESNDFPEERKASVGTEDADVFGISPRSSEHRSKRAQLLMTPSLHKKVAKKAASLNMSFNELVNLVLEKYVQ